MRAVMRELPLERYKPEEVSPDGSRGTNARITAAMIAREAPTQRRLESTVRLIARTEKRDAYRARIATIGCAVTTPSAAPVQHNKRLSERSMRRSARLLAPSAVRTASSPSLRTVLARIKLATLEHAMINMSADAASKTSKTV